MLVDALFAAKDFDDAEDVLRAAIRENMTDARVEAGFRVRLGLVLGAGGRELWSAAERELRRAARLDAGNADARLALADFLHDVRKDKPSAVAEYKELLHGFAPLPFDVEEAREEDPRIAKALKRVSIFHVAVLEIERVLAGCEVPARYLCPISRRIMWYPVVAPDGTRYERYYLNRWLDSDWDRRRSPLTMAPMDPSPLQRDLALDREIGDFVSKMAEERSRR